MDSGMDMSPPGSQGMDRHSGMEMHMDFYWDKTVQLMFSGWSSSTLTQYLLSLAALFVLGFFHQALIYIRTYIFDQKERGDGQKEGLLVLEKRPVMKSAVETVCFACNAATGYLLMLAVMSYNVGVFVVIIGGLSLGFFFFSVRKKSASVSKESVHQTPAITSAP